MAGKGGAGGRYQAPFPRALEAAFAPLDDAAIAVCQWRTAGVVYAFVMVLTFLTAIEALLVFPAALYALGYDTAGGLAANVLIVLGVVSQVPKKFILRARPWMVGRAVAVRRDTTSSFPSRAVACAVVFSWLVVRAAELEGFVAALPAGRVWAGISLVAALTAFARVNVGAHYPSDTLCGFVLGCVVIRLGAALDAAWGAAGCSIPAAYPPDATASFASVRDVLQDMPYGRLVTSLALCYAMTLISITGFWVKCSYVYGLLLSALTFRHVFLCSDSGVRAGFARVVPGSISLRVHANVVAALLGVLAFGMLTRGRKGVFRIFAFSLIYFGTLAIVLYSRLRVDADFLNSF